MSTARMVELLDVGYWRYSLDGVMKLQLRRQSCCGRMMETQLKEDL